MLKRAASAAFFLILVNNNMANIANIDQLVQAGLAPKSQLPYARIVLSDPKQGIESMVYRGLAIKIFGKMADMMLNDATIYNRMRQLLLSKPMNESEDYFDNKTVSSGSPKRPDDVVLHVHPKTLIKAHQATDPDGAEYSHKRAEGIKKHVASGKKLSMPEVSAHEGQLRFINGRNRSKWASDNGLKKIPIAVHKDVVHHVKKILSLHESLPGEGTPEAVEFAVKHTPMANKSKIIKRLAKEKSNV